LEKKSESCPLQCPGCHSQHLDEKKSARIKTQWLKNQLNAWEDKFEPIMAKTGPDRLGYRDMVCLCSQWNGKKWDFGLRSGQTIVAIDTCPVHCASVNMASAVFSQILPPENFFPLKYYVQSGSQIVLVLACSEMPDISWFDNNIADCLKQMGIQGLWLHLFPSAGKRVFAKQKWHIIWGKPRSRDVDGMLYGPTAFRQLTFDLHSHALKRVLDFFNPGPGDKVVDLYCGTGRSLAAWTARKAAACGIEISAEAVECARLNAPGAIVLRGLCTHRIPQLDQWISGTSSTARLVFANPPRTGLEPEIRKWITRQCRPQKMAYLSCSAGTLQRDLKYLEETGLMVSRICPYDFFPNTRHVETCVMLERRL
jgi:tRNA/tmRNA/rRNA uracil-C5-methylase (TrmA/RlmC/RlmD family)